MDLMTTDQLREKAGIGTWTTEGPHIKRVQQALTAYHAAPDQQKAQRLAALDEALKSWQKAHTPSTNLTGKSRERGKRRAVDELHWQVEATLVDEERSLVMTVADFRRAAGIGLMTIEGDKIKAVQTSLQRYHDEGDPVAKAQALRALQGVIETWRASHVSPLGLSGRSSRKMAAMEQLRWQLTILTTDEPPAPLDDPGGMADHLRDDVVVVHDTGDATRDKLRTLMGRLASHYADHVRQHALDPRGESAIRIGTVDIETWDLLRLNKDKCPLGSDGIDDGTTEPPLMSYDATTQQAFLAYLKSLLTNELNGRRELAVAAGALGGKHRAQIIADYYFARSVDQISLHKDTFGTTLFVALHYLNKSDMTGPEYIYDRWPIAGREPYDHGGVAITDKAWMRTSDGKQGRPRAPWSKNAKYEVGGVNLQFEQQRMLDAAATHFWPHDLIASLEAARAGLPTTKKVQMSELHPYGLISFVDELIYHSTPLTRNRTLEDSEKVAFQLVVTGGLDFYVGVDGGKAPMNLRRRMSFALNGGDFEPKTGFADKRTFLRLWITVAPKSWYTPWTSWKLR